MRMETNAQLGSIVPKAVGSCEAKDHCEARRTLLRRLGSGRQVQSSMQGRSCRRMWQDGGLAANRTQQTGLFVTDMRAVYCRAWSKLSDIRARVAERAGLASAEMVGLADSHKSAHLSLRGEGGGERANVVSAHLVMVTGAQVICLKLSCWPLCVELHAGLTSSVSWRGYWLVSASKRSTLFHQPSRTTSF